MIERRDRLNFTLEALGVGRICSLGRGDEFDRHGTLLVSVNAPPNLGHSSLADYIVEFERPAGYGGG